MTDLNAQVRRSVGATPDATDFGSVHWAVRAGDPDGAEQTLGLAVFDAGKSNVEHTHPECEEIVYVMAGEVRHTLNDDATVLSAGDLIVVPRGVPHRLMNDSAEPVRALIVFSSPDRTFVPTGR